MRRETDSSGGNTRGAESSDLMELSGLPGVGDEERHHAGQDRRGNLEGEVFYESKTSD